jgi:hypothetical protein
VRRLIAAVLLVLAASPLTAPFSIGNPLDLFGGATAQIQSKKNPDAPTAHLDGPPADANRLEVVLAAGPAPVTSDHTASLPLNRPLRV